MHILHCVLTAIPDGCDDEDLIEICRQEALSATEDYANQVFDWRADDAGRWAEEYPNKGVILGSEDPDSFKEHLTAWKDRPLQAAKEALEMVTLVDRCYRTDEQLAADGAERLKPPAPDGRSRSGIPAQLPPVGPELIQAAWDSGGFWFLASALALATGEYRFESGFYSVPDATARISRNTLRDAMETPGKYALVFLDYHL